MSTSATIHFQYGPDIAPEAIIYLHYDGYPNAVLPDLGRFFRAVQAQTDDTRFNDPAYLAAKFVVWQASEFTKDKPNLDFTGIGIISDDQYDIDYRYHVISQPSHKQFPKVTVEQV